MTTLGNLLVPWQDDNALELANHLGIQEEWLSKSCKKKDLAPNEPVDTKQTQIHFVSPIPDRRNHRGGGGWCLRSQSWHNTSAKK